MIANASKGGPIIPKLLVAVTLRPRGRHCSRSAERWSLGMDSGPDFCEGLVKKVTVPYPFWGMNSSTVFRCFCRIALLGHTMSLSPKSSRGGWGIRSLSPHPEKPRKKESPWLMRPNKTLMTYCFWLININYIVCFLLMGLGYWLSSSGVQGAPVLALLLLLPCLCRLAAAGFSQRIQFQPAKWMNQLA